MKKIPLRNIAIISMLLAVGGCNRSGLANATGRLTYKGQPVPSTYVVFQPEDTTKRASHGLTDDDGRFTLTNSKSLTGVYLGPNTVSLRYHLTADEEMGKMPPKASKELKAVIARYADSKTSKLHYEVKKDGDFFDIQLSD
jgi:hypothetical protein